MAARKIIISVTVTLALLAGCAASSGGIFGRGKPDAERKAKLTERARVLEIDWEILRKDDPPQNQTFSFRTGMSNAHKSLASGDLDEAEKEITTAEQWIAEARPRYSREHETRVVAGTSKETSSALMASAESFKEKGVQAKAAGDQVASARYLQAAVEDGELAIIAAGRSGEGPEALARLIDEMSGIYTAAGHPEKTAELRGRIVKALQAGIDSTGKQIETRLRNDAPGFEEARLRKEKTFVDEAIVELNQLNDLYRRQVADANAFAPGQIQFADYGNRIANFTNVWLRVHDKSLTPPPPPPPPKDDCPSIIQAHNAIKRGAQNMAGSGISLEETEVYIEGNRVVIRGKVQNLRTTPILNPRVVVTGGVMSTVRDLGYPSMAPTHSTTFQLPLDCFTVEAYNRSMNAIPSHELLLIFNEPNGTERKLIQSITRGGG